MICGKERYVNRQAAMTAIAGKVKDNRVTKSQKHSGRTYFCQECSAWHIATNNKNSNKKKRISQFAKKENDSTPLFRKQERYQQVYRIHTNLKIK